MSSPQSTLKYSELTERIIGIFYEVYNELGHGFLESTYSSAMAVAMTESGMKVEQEVPVPVWFHGQKVGQYFADLIVGRKIILELKAAKRLDSAHQAQLLHYLRATEFEVGILFNFGSRPQFRRLLFDNERKKVRDNPFESVAKVLA
ncbi:MAG: GxxExxY protein [Candidatus Sulfotelmatobacter sp.]